MEAENLFQIRGPVTSSNLSPGRFLVASQMIVRDFSRTTKFNFQDFLGAGNMEEKHCHNFPGPTGIFKTIHRLGDLRVTKPIALKH